MTALRNGTRTGGPATVLAVRVGAGLALLAAWQVLVDAFAADYVARPTGVAAVLPDVLGGEEFWLAVEGTMGAVALGFGVGVAAGVVGGVVLGRVPVARMFVGPWVSAFYALPFLATVPLLTLWLGYTDIARVVIVSYAAFLPVLFSTLDGARSVPREYLEVAGSFRAPRWRVWFGIALPAALPYVLAGIRLAVGAALTGAVVAELLVALPGLGFYIQFNAGSFHQDEAAVAALFLALLGVLANGLVDLLTRRLSPWYREGA